MTVALVDVTGDTVVINDITAQANMPVIGILKQAIDFMFSGRQKWRSRA